MATFMRVRSQAELFLHGKNPYECTTRITTVNIIVLCSVWYMFIDQAHYAFFPREADYPLALLNFIIWTILCFELAFEVFIRPDGYRKLIKSEKAYMPITVRHISRLHLIVEFLSLGFFVPEFLCIFQQDLSCSAPSNFSFLHAVLRGVTGETRLQALTGRIFLAVLRLRIFGLVRHWRNMWINRIFLKSKGNRGWTVDVAPVTEKIQSLDESVAQNEQLAKVQQKRRDAALINASNIGTALMTTNSYRAVTILCAMAGIFPMITLIFYNGVANSVASDMVKQLQGTNTMISIEHSSSCDFLVNSVASWINSMSPRDKTQVTTRTDDFILALGIQPSRCIEEFESLDIPGLAFMEVPCMTLVDFQMEVDNYGDCIVGVIRGTEELTLRSLSDHFNLRIGSITTVSSVQATKMMTLENGSSFLATFAVSAHFNQTNVVVRA